MTFLIGFVGFIMAASSEDAENLHLFYGGITLMCVAVLAATIERAVEQLGRRRGPG